MEVCEKTTSIYLVRHGQSTSNANENFDNLPNHEIHLTELGRQQAKKVAKWIKMGVLPGCGSGEFLNSDSQTNKHKWKPDVRIYTSPFERAVETANFIIDELNATDVCEDSMLSEFDTGIQKYKNNNDESFKQQYGDFQELKKYNGKYYTRFPDGESPMECEVRQRIFLDRLYRDMDKPDCPSRIIIVGHGLALSLLRKSMMGYTVKWWENQPHINNCSVISLTNSNKTGMYDHGEVYSD